MTHKLPPANPVLVNVIRGNQVESCHTGSAVVARANGDVVFSVGNIDSEIYPRSALKLIQAIPLIESGAADHYGLTDNEIAIACASHSAEPFHVDVVQQWLTKLNLAEADLECGQTLPYSDKAAHELIASHQQPGRVHHNCSGKHTGMLTVARHLKEETKGYSLYDHPVQVMWMRTLSDIISLDASRLTWERDGCGLPALAVPMLNLAMAYARFAAPDQIFSDSRTRAISRIHHAVTRCPKMIAGTGRCCTAVIEKTGGKVIVKLGAEGVYSGYVPGRGLGFILKIDDGATRASEVALGALLSAIGATDDGLTSQLTSWFRPEISNSQHWRTGRIEPSGAWPQ